jgi:hypothetical protein
MTTITRLSITVLILTFQIQTYSQRQGSSFEEQFAPKFSGTWKFNKEKSAKNASLARFEDWTMQISQDKGAIKISRTIKIKGKARTDELTYYPDDRGEENPTGFGKEKRKTTTLWRNAKMVMRFTLSMYAMGDFLKQDIVDTLEVSSDGQTLTIITDAREPRGNTSLRGNPLFQPSVYVKVFDKVR